MRTRQPLRNVRPCKIENALTSATGRLVAPIRLAPWRSLSHVLRQETADLLALLTARRKGPAPIDYDDVNIVAGSRGFPCSGGHALNKDLRRRHQAAA
jgi:hypothetical protein